MCPNSPALAAADSHEETDRSGHPLQIRSWSELQAHLEVPGKRAAYRKFLAEFGIDAEASEVRGLGERPSLLFAEQPGCWYSALDLVRARLLERLIQRGPFDAELSGVRTLAHDRFTAVGDKGTFLNFALHPSLGPAQLVGSQFHRKFEHRTYASLKLASHSYLRLRTIWDYSLRLIEAASISPREFVDIATQIFNSGPMHGVRDILPESNDPDGLLEIGEDVARCRLEPAFQALWPARARLTKGIAWDVYWNQVNSEFLETRIEPLEPLLGRYLLAVTDPVRLGRCLHEASGLDPEVAVSVAGIVSDDDVFRTVHFDPRDESFFVIRRDGQRRQVTWDEVRSASDFGARPSGVLEYLLFAAFGSYLLVDAGDGIHEFHEIACATHVRYTGVGFPWVTFPVRGPLATTGDCFLEIFRPGFAETTVGILSDFFER
jgi:hypothetical protein